MSMDSILLAVLSLFAAGGFGMALWVILRPPAVSFEPPPAYDSESIRALFHDDLASMVRKIDELEVAVAHGIEHVTRTERRIKSTVARARAQFRESGFEHDGIEDAHSEISEWDGGGGEEPRLPLLPEDVGPSQSSIPGVSSETLAKVRRLG